MNDNQMVALATVMLRIDEICWRTKLSRSFIYALLVRGVFPPLVSLGERARGLPADELDLWLAQCLALRDQMDSLSDSVELPQWGPPVVEVPHPGIVLLTREQVQVRAGFERSQLYCLMEARLFPWPAPIADKARRWAEHEVQEWLDQRRSERFRDLKRRHVWPVSRSGSRPDQPSDEPSDERSDERSDKRRDRGF